MKRFHEASTLSLICILSWFLSNKNYLLFHSVIEITTVVISFSVLLLAVGVYKLSDNYYFIYLGIIYGFIGVLDLFHAFTYKGIIIFTNSANISTQLWIIARYSESVALLFSFYYLKRKINIKSLLLLNFTIIPLFLYSVFIFKTFPTCYIEGYGLTNFKIYSEYLICSIYIAVLFLLIKNKLLIKGWCPDFILSILFKIISEISFTLYIGVYDFPNFFGHIMKLVSFYFFYKVLFNYIILKPYTSLFKNLNSKTIELENKNNELTYAKTIIEMESIKYKSLIEFMPDGIIVTYGMKVSLVNDTFCSMLNIDPKDKGDLINKNLKELIEVSSHEKLKERFHCPSKDLLKIPTEYVIFYNNKRINTEISTLFLEDQEGKEYTLSVVRDITDRKKAEEIEALLTEKEQEDTLKNEFFSNISHELRTPINVIYSAIQLENMYSAKEDYKSIIKYNGSIKQNCLRLIRIVNNIIDVTKIETGFLKPNLRTQNIVNIIEDITLSVVSYSEYKNIKVVFDTDYEELYVTCDENLLERILLNLLSNSVKYGNENGHIEVNVYRKDDDYVSIVVKDDGIGIPYDLQEKVFERFEKVDKSISRNSEGSGIGLYLVKLLVELQNGTISMKSEINKGTEITLSFPLTEEMDEICATSMEDEYKSKIDISEKVSIEFSDIYFSE